MTTQSGNPNDAVKPQAAPAGWYPVAGGQQYWDGIQWVGHVQPGPPAQFGKQQILINGTKSDERMLALLAHLLFFVAAGIGPLVLYLIKKDESQFIRQHAAAALNFVILVLVVQFSTLIPTIVVFTAAGPESPGSSVGLVLFLLSYGLAFLFFIAGAIFSVLGAVAANKGLPYRYPVSFRFVK